MRALLVSGDTTHADALVAALAGLKDAIEVEVAPTPAEALDAVAGRTIDILVVDLAGPAPPDAVEFIKAARSRALAVPIVALVPSPETSVEALAAGADGFGPRDPGRPEAIATVLRQTSERFQPGPDAPLRVLYVTRRAPMRDESVSTPMTIDVVVPTARAALPAPYDTRPLDYDAAVLDASEGGADLVGIAQDLVTRLGTAPLFVLADSTDRQLARAVLRLGARQVVARTGAWPVRLFAAIQQAGPQRRDGARPAEGIPIEEHRALAMQLEAVLAELDATRAGTEARVQQEAAELRTSWQDAMREVEAARAADNQAASREIGHLQTLIRQQAFELAAAREAAADAEAGLKRAHEAAAQAARDADEARQAPPAPQPPPLIASVPDDDRGFTPTAADFVQEIARHAADAARLQRESLESSTAGPDLASAQRALAAAERAREVAQQFLAFDESRRGWQAPLDLTDLLASLHPLLAAVTGTIVRLGVAVPVARTVLVNAPRAGTTRVIASLVASAVEALPLGGYIDVTAGLDEPREPSQEVTAHVTVAARGFGMRPLRAPEVLVSPLPPWGLDLRLRETEQGTAYELVVPAMLATSEPGTPEPSAVLP